MDLNEVIIPFYLTISLASCIDVSIDTEKIHRFVNQNFIHVAIDSGTVRRNWENFSPNSTKVKTLARGLAPCYLRIGGTDADFLLFINDKTTNKQSTGIQRKLTNENRKQYRSSKYEHITNFTMTASFYDQIHKFTSSVGWDLIFDLNSLLRNPDGAWDPSNAGELINYTAQSGYKMGGWELGNEPDEYTDIKVKHKFIPPEQLADDFALLRRIIKSYPSFHDCQILGPSLAALSDYWRKGFFYSFMSSGGGDSVTAATFHQYYEEGHTAKKEEFYDVDILNVLQKEIQSGVNLTRAAGSSAKVWIGETSNAYNSGAPNISDRYIAAFQWLDKLGMSARDGIDAVVRQTFYGGHYSLLDYDTLDPNPDYWLTLLYKLLVGNRVLRVTSPDSSGQLRVYAHCTESTRSGYPPGSVTVYIMNVGTSSKLLSFSQFPQGTLLHVYNMTPLDDDLLAKFVTLNGKVLNMVNERTLPNLLQPEKQSYFVNIQPFTYSFIVIPDAKVKVCL